MHSFLKCQLCSRHWISCWEYSAWNTTQTLGFTVQLSEVLLDVAETESGVQPSGLIILGQGFGKPSRARGVWLAHAVRTRGNETTGRIPTSSLKTSKTLQSITTPISNLEVPSCALTGPRTPMHGYLGSNPGGGLRPSLVRRVKQLCVGVTEDRVEGGELSSVHNVCTSLCSVVDTSLPLPDTHLSHLSGQPSCLSVRCNELAFGFTP